MSSHEKNNDLSNVIRFPVEAVSRAGFQRAVQRGNSRSAKMEREGQMTLFGESPPEAAPGTVVPLPLQMTAFEEALVLDERGDDRAEEVYIQAIEEGDREADAWCNLGVLKSLDGELDLAFDCFAESLAAEPYHAESHYNMANLYFEMGDLRLARTHYEKALDTNEEFANAWFNYGLVTALGEDYRTAYDALTRYKTLAPDADGTAVADELLGYIRTAIHLT
jgi:tetratricopeptide (TPR) repeat protein